MREIKFRMWNPAKNGFHFDVENVYECLMQQHRHDKTQPSRFNALYYDHKSEGMVWQQYTGLKDKNGKEIYEGDIVYLAGYGDYVVEFPFTQLYTSAAEGDVEEIKGNIYEHKHLLK